MDFQQLIERLCSYWAQQGCTIHLPYDLEMGAGTFHPATFLRCLGPEPYRTAFVQPSRRPTDGRYGQNPNRVGRFYQFQVLLKPSPPNAQELYLQSLRAVGLDLDAHDIRFVHDDWESPTLGAWGLGWEVWCDGMEISQYTYFQAAGGVSLKPVSVELTYGLERLAMYLQGADRFFDMSWNREVTYGDVYHRSEVEWSRYNFEEADVTMWRRHFEDYEREAKRLVTLGLPLPAHDFVTKASHAFNMLDARGVISVAERANTIARVRALACLVAEGYLESRKQLGYPLLRHSAPVAPRPQLAALPEPKSLEGRETLLFEIGSEELPATFVPIGMRELEAAMRRLLAEADLPFETLHCYGTARRLAVLVRGLVAGRTGSSSERRGPPLAAAFDAAGQLTPVGAGFLKSLGKPAVNLEAVRAGLDADLWVGSHKEREYLMARVQTPPIATVNYLAEQLGQAVLKLNFPKTMRWGDGEISYPRPLRWLVALYGDTVIPVQLEQLVSGRTSEGHPQRKPGPVEISHPEQYVETLRTAEVMVSPDERRAVIERQLADICQKQNLVPHGLERLLNEVVHLTEWPECILAQFDSRFLEAPKEVLISEMVEHQRYFPLLKPSGALDNRFVVACNHRPTELMRAGYERVLMARLSDGLFLYNQDLKTPLDQFNERLKTVDHLRGLGTLYDKVERVTGLAGQLSPLIPGASQALAERAAHLCKADLVSEMVKEFPALQGAMGRIYALAHNEPAQVAHAIEEHYLPRSEEDRLPATPEGIVVSLADKLDNLISCFAGGLKPTSSSDPYALRRQALGLIRIILSQRLRIPLRPLLLAAHNRLPVKNPEAINEVIQFLLQRARTVFQEFTCRPDTIEAALAAAGDDLYDALQRIEALQRFRSDEARCSALYEVVRRATGQATGFSPQTVQPALLTEPAEKALYTALTRTVPLFTTALQQSNYDGAYQLLADLQPPLAALFERLLILHDDAAIRHNRIALLQAVTALCNQLLDFDQLKM